MNIENYFSDDRIIKLLCKYRATQAGKRHDLHKVRNFSVHPKTNKILISQNKQSFKEINEFFPPRRKWKKLYRSERKIYTDSLKASEVRLYKSYTRTKRDVDLNKIIAPNWYINLIDFVSNIKNSISNIENCSIESPRITGIKKDEKDGIIEYRPIAVYDMKSKIICSLTAKYFTDFFDETFLDCSYAFRSKNLKGNVPSHHDCVERILEKRKKSGKLWVAECDIQKFFDTVNHSYLLSVFDSLTTQLKLEGKIIDVKSREILQLFLKSYSFQNNIYNLNENLEWFAQNNLEPGRFKWIKKELDEAFGDNYCANNSIGVPQGNAISCFIANLILHEVDQTVIKSSKDIFYIRYCDDMILMHSEKTECDKALKSFMEGLDKNFLLYHKPIENVSYKKDSYVFWNESKSKLPFQWDDKNISEYNVPWLSFVGYQINYDGKVRVRKKTLIKETKKQVSETQKVIHNLGKAKYYQRVGDHHSRWSKRQIVFSLHQRLISMSVGRIKVHNHKTPLKQGLCWTNGFKSLTNNNIASKQLRYLDKRRHHQIKRLKLVLERIKRKSEKTTFEEDKVHYGAAFSYFNFLKHK